MVLVGRDPEITTSTIATRRDGVTGNYLSGIRAQIDPAKLVYAPEGPRRQQFMYVALGLDIIPDDWIDAVGDSGTAYSYKAVAVDSVEGDEGYTLVQIEGGRLPS